ncbi:MarR family winged helix-turn-helix transcriptional regulator [Rhodobium gokarnense]|uniref:DNA-binding MarR family transcriptional regulator n=1 Tax=Rhodobium gokarnense TaxID=364296 RepID=A0ABT3HE30_9HYPH|nr:MarR family winged helix-turn-helix transcriptional regulator [Rhodobium gokarnense]MCW2308594.1 DNA-binding MarR family transcriptional regulator [Rhodobium gokarnense]
MSDPLGPAGDNAARHDGYAQKTAPDPASDATTPDAHAIDNAAHVMKAIRRIVRANDVRSKKVAREAGLTIPQIVVLQAVRDFGQLTTAALSRQADLSAATTVTILDKLEARGLVTRRRSDTDRRIVRTRLTEEGERILKGAPALFGKRFVTGFADLPETEQQRIVAAFRAVADLVDPPLAEAGAGEDVDLG